MKIAIDISIMTKSDGAFANVTGTITLEVIPQVGDTISFAFPKTQNVAPVLGFTGMLRVADRVLDAGEGPKVSIALEDVILSTVQEARAVGEYLEKGFGLTVDPY
jgi:hypothetical protein